MDSATTDTTSPAAEPVSPQGVAADPFTIYLQSYLIRRGLDEGFIKENITSQVILDSFRGNQDTTLGPAKSLGRKWEDRNSDRVCTDHLQRYLITNGFEPEFAAQVTGPHIVDSIIDVMPEELLPKTPLNQTTSVTDKIQRTVDAPRKDSAFAARSEDYDEDEDLPTKHRRTSRARYLKERASGRITKRARYKPQPTLDLAKNYHEIKTACLASLELSEDSTFNSSVSSPEYTTFLHDCSLFLGARLATISVALARAEDSQKAVSFGQFGLDLLGPALFNANVALQEDFEDEQQSILYSKMSVVDCYDEISQQWDMSLATELADMAKGHGMWWVKPVVEN